MRSVERSSSVIEELQRGTVKQLVGDVHECQWQRGSCSRWLELEAQLLRAEPPAPDVPARSPAPLSAHTECLDEPVAAAGSRSCDYDPLALYD